MLVLVAVALVTLAVSAFVALERQSARLHAGFDRERGQWARERQLLLNRIDPATAQAVADPLITVATPGFRKAVSIDDDDAYWESRESREQLAERLMQEELGAAA